MLSSYSYFQVWVGLLQHHVDLNEGTFLKILKIICFSRRGDADQSIDHEVFNPKWWRWLEKGDREDKRKKRKESRWKREVEDKKKEMKKTRGRKITHDLSEKAEKWQEDKYKRKKNRRRERTESREGERFIWTKKSTYPCPEPVVGLEEKQEVNLYSPVSQPQPCGLGGEPRGQPAPPVSQLVCRLETKMPPPHVGSWLVWRIIGWDDSNWVIKTT